MMHLAGKKRIHLLFNHHEQACAIASEGYTRLCGKPGVVCVTTGPGGTNAVSGVLGQWLDSIPALYISGQVRYDTTVAGTGLPLRQFGDQEANIVEIVKSITKYAVMVTDPKSIRFHLQKALYLATHGRPGPVWLDIPLNVQSALVDDAQLFQFDPSAEREDFSKGTVLEQINALIGKMKLAKRPLFLIGAGVRLSRAENEALRLVEKANIPVQVAWDAIDLLPSDHPLYAGRPSTVGQRGANFIFQNCDLLISIGCRLNVRQIGYTFPSVARAAYKVSVDIDKNELIKPSLTIDLPIQADAKYFLEQLFQALEDTTLPAYGEWLTWCRDRVYKYPTVLPEYKHQTKWVNPYVFSQRLSQLMADDEIVISSNGASCVIPIQSMEIRAGQRHIVNSGCASMGYGLPAAIGACLANHRKRVICLEGDGSIQLNIQELETLSYNHLPVKNIHF